jgi:hypothetical protein
MEFIGRHRDHPMNTRFPDLFRAAFLVLSAGPLCAYPIGDIVAHASGSHGAVTDGRCVAVNVDRDPDLEIYGGGNWVAQPTGHFVNGGSGPHTYIPLPEPNRSPYGVQHPIFWNDCSGDAADVDNDGDIDLVRAVRMYYNYHAENRHVLAVYLNNGDGVFTIGWQKTYEGEPVASIRCGDFDRDGDPDVLQVSQSKVRILWNGGQASGQFGTATTVADRIGSAVQAEVTDADRDGWPDLAWFHYTNGTYRLYHAINDHDGTFTVYPGFSTTAMPRQLTAHDMDRDGWMDLVHSYNISTFSNGQMYLSGLVTWSRNQSGSFGTPTPIATAPGTAIGSFSMVDLDEDGDTDLFYSTDGGVEIEDHAWVAYRSSGTSFAAAKQMWGQAMLSPGAVACDVDADGDPDVCSLGDANTILWLYNQAIHPSPAASVLEHSGPALAGAASLTTGDLDSDGVADLIVACPEEKRLIWYQGGSISLTGPISVSTANLAPTSATTGDFDGDGDADLAYTVQGSSTIYTALSFNGAGTVFTTAPAASMSGVTRLHAADADHDGDNDLLAVAPSAGVVRWYKNDGTAGTWLPENVATGLAQPAQAATLQIVGGGRPEVAVRTAHGYRVLKSTPSWQLHNEFFTPSDAMATADLDRDGRPDLVLADSLGTVYWTNIQGSFGQATIIGKVDGLVRRLCVIDWNRDGWVDVLCAWHGGITLLSNGPSGWSSVPLATGADFGDVVPLRLNNDDRPDAVAHNATTGKLALLVNTSWEVRIDQARAAVTPSATIRPGHTAPVIRMRVTHPGRLNDSRIFPSLLKVRLLKATGSGPSFTAGAPLTQQEVDELVDALIVYNESFQEIGRSQNVTMDNGFLSVSQTMAGDVGVSAGRTRDLLLCVALKPGAASAANQRFFVDHRAVPVLSPGSTWSYGAGSVRTLRAISPSAALVTLVEVTPLAPLPAWRKAWWNVTASTGIAANHADPDSDGVPNVVEYVHGTDPTRAEHARNSARALTLLPLTEAELSSGYDLPLDVTLGYYWDDTVKVELQESTNLKSWSPLAARVGREAWSGVVPDRSAAPGEGTAFRFIKNAAAGHSPARSFRLLVSETP